MLATKSTLISSDGSALLRAPSWFAKIWNAATPDDVGREWKTVYAIFDEASNARPEREDDDPALGG